MDLDVDTKEEIMNQINNEWTTLDPGTRLSFIVSLLVKSNEFLWNFIL